MTGCRNIQASLPEYVTGRYLPDRDRIAGHLSRCSECDGHRRELEAVFSLLEVAPEPPESPHGESIAKLALRSETAQGPLRANRLQRRHEDLRLALCSLTSLTATAGLALWLYVAGGPRAAMLSGVKWLSALPTAPDLWPQAALFALGGGLVVLLPVLIPVSRPASGQRAQRRA